MKKEHRRSPNSIAANVARLRAERGMTQVSLAEKAGLTRVTLGLIERGRVIPRSDTLTQLADALRVPLRELLVTRKPLRGVRFRAKKRVNGREQILAEVSAWLEAYRWLEEELAIPHRSALEALAGRSLDPHQLALETRSCLGLDRKEPIRDICGFLEDNSIKVLLLAKKTDSFFGLSVAKDSGGPAVVVNAWDRVSVERSNLYRCPRARPSLAPRGSLRRFQI